MTTTLQWSAVAARVLAVALMTTGLAACSDGSGAGGDEAVSRIGYPVTTLINGQVGAILERTNILELSGVDAEVFRFTHGPPSNEAMAAGEINLQFTSEAPGVSSIAQGIEAAVVFTLGESRDGVVVPKDSDIRTVEDLHGHTIGVPVGTTPYIHLVQMLNESGLDHEKDVTLRDIAPEELAAALAQGSVDAVAYNEPLPTRLEKTLGARVVGEHSFFYTALMRRDFIKEHPEDAARVLAAVARAVVFMANNRDVVDGWFSEVSETEIEVIQEASLHTAAYAETEDIDDVSLGLTDEDVERLQADADLLAEHDLIDSVPDMRDNVDTTVWEAAQEILAEEDFSFEDVSVED